MDTHTNGVCQPRARRPRSTNDVFGKMSCIKFLSTEKVDLSCTASGCAAFESAACSVPAHRHEIPYLVRNCKDYYRRSSDTVST